MVTLTPLSSDDLFWIYYHILLGSLGVLPEVRDRVLGEFSIRVRSELRIRVQGEFRVRFASGVSLVLGVR